MGTTLYAIDLRPGHVVNFDNAIHRVVAHESIKTGRGGTSVRLRLENMKSGQKQDVRLDPSSKLVSPFYESIPYPIFYDNGEEIVCFTAEDQEIAFPKHLVDPDSLILALDEEAEGRQLLVHWVEGEIFTITLPRQATVIVAETDPGGPTENHASAFHPARLRNGWVIQVPVHIRSGDKVVIDTEKREYLSQST